MRNKLMLALALTLAGCDPYAKHDAQIQAQYQTVLNQVLVNTFGVVCPGKRLRQNGLVFPDASAKKAPSVYPVIVICANGKTYNVTGLKTK